MKEGRNDMKITCDKTKLIEALSLGQRALSPNSTLEAIKGYLIQGTEEGISVSSYNLETGIVTTIPATSVAGESIVINGRILFDIIRRLPEDTLSIEVNEKGVAVIRSGNSEFNIMTLPAQEFPDMPRIDSDRQLTLPQGLLKSMISQTIFAVSQSEYKPILTGCCFDIRGNILRVVALDSSRLSMREEEISTIDSGDAYSFVVPGAALREVEKILKDSDEDMVNIFLSRKHIIFDMGQSRLFCRLLEGEYTKYETIIPKESRYSVLANNKSFLESLERVSILINEQQKTHVRLKFEKNSIHFSTETLLGNGYDECVCNGDAEGVEIGFSSRFLSDAIRSVDADECEFAFSGSLTPFVIRPVTGNRFLHIIAPVRIAARN